jgi:hypothetical protein
MNTRTNRDNHRAALNFYAKVLDLSEQPVTTGEKLIGIKELVSILSLEEIEHIVSGLQDLENILPVISGIICKVTYELHQDELVRQIFNITPN